ncbi:MAG TPA: biosynthetic-type acetolactate synthase large subunit [Bacillota bacterium]|nr:biosynthetic-type acetolactate synthase large subunit [Bacillota bacterium]HPL53015.1 biosynthetic-type acetolactate synthase large subunit [Bacillota bacterium]
MKLKVAEVLLECLREQGVDTIFGYPGGTVINIYDALYNRKDITHILTVHEQGATHAADGYARATGKVGIVLVTSGPGASNTVTGIATAYRDSVPMVVITGQVARPLLGKDSFQELDIRSITKPITKKNYMVKNPEALPEIVRDAFRIARSGRPGPVLIDIPKDVQMTEIEYQPMDIINSRKAVSSLGFTKETSSNLDKAVELINNSKRPVIYAGGGVKISDSCGKLLKFAEKLKSPVCCSLMGIGTFPGTHPYFMGLIGMHGSRCSNTAICNCDLLIAVGARFSDRTTCKADEFAQYADIIQIDIDPQELGKNVNIRIPLCGDVNKYLELLTERVEEKKLSAWSKQIQNWKEAYAVSYKSNGSLNPQYLLNKLYELTAGKSIVTTEVGQNQMWAAQYYTFTEPRTFISSGGLGTMGYGLSAAIGAAVGRPDYRVINIAGDGSFRMNLAELSTISKYKLPIIQVLLNNNSLGMVRQWQKFFFNERYSHTSLKDEINYGKLADAFGIRSMRIIENSEVEKVFAEALEINEPALIECMIHPDDLVLPMVPAGEPISECIGDF